MLFRLHDVTKTYGKITAPERAECVAYFDKVAAELSKD
jgi:hypothetical protein